MVNLQMITHFDHFPIYSFICRFVDLFICRLYGKLLPSGESASFEDLASDSRGHPRAEPVLLGSLSLLRLIDAFRHAVSILAEGSVCQRLLRCLITPPERGSRETRESFLDNHF